MPYGAKKSFSGQGEPMFVVLESLGKKRHQLYAQLQE